MRVGRNVARIALVPMSLGVKAPDTVVFDAATGEALTGLQP